MQEVYNQTNNSINLLKLIILTNNNKQEQIKI